MGPSVNLARVSDPSRLKAQIRISETQTRDLAIGQKAKVDTRNGIVRGHVTNIDPASQGGTVALTGVTFEGAREAVAAWQGAETRERTAVRVLGKDDLSRAPATLLEDPEWTRRYHAKDPRERAFGGRVVITFEDGHSLTDEIAVADEKERDFARGEFGQEPFMHRHDAAQTLRERLAVGVGSDAFPVPAVEQVRQIIGK